MTFPRLISRHPRAALLLLLAALGGCQYFSHVIIPASDDQLPLSVVSVYDVAAGDYAEMSLMLPLRYEVTDPEAVYMAVGATYDNGGAKRLAMFGMWVYYCSESGVGYVAGEILAGPGALGPEATVGDEVSNGLWSYYTVRFADAPLRQPRPCAGGRRLPQRITFKWYTDSYDYHDNHEKNEGELVYYPYGH
jgi:hypothetical protein